MEIVAESVKNDGEAVRSVRRLNDRRGKHEEEELLLGMNLTRLRTAASSSSSETANVSASHQRQDFAGEDDDNDNKFKNKNDEDTNNYNHLLHLSAVAYCPINQILIVHGGYAKPPLSSSMPDALVVSSQKGRRTTQIEAKQEERSPLLGGDEGSFIGEEKSTVTTDSVLIKSLSKRKNTSTKRARQASDEKEEEKEDGKNVDDDPASHQVHTVNSSDDEEDNDGYRHTKKGSSAGMARGGTARQEQGEQKKEYTPRPHGHLYALEVKTGRWHALSSSYPPFSFSPPMTSPSRASFDKKGGRDEKEENNGDFCDAKSVDAVSVCHPSSGGSGSNRNLFTSSSSSPQPLHSHVGFFTNGGDTFVVHGGLSQLSSPVPPTIENEGRRVGGGRGSRRKFFPQSSSSSSPMTQIISNETYAYHWRRGHWERLTHLFGGDEAPRMYGHAVLPLLLLPKTTSSSSSFSAFSPSSDNAEKAADFSQHLLYPSLSSSSSSSSTSSDATSFIVVGSVSSSSSSFLTPTPSGGSSDRYITSMGKKSDRGRRGETTNQRVIGGVQRRRVDGGDNPSRPRPRPRRDLQQERQLAMAVYAIDLNRNGGKVWRRIAIDEDHRHLYNSNKDNTSVRGGGFVVKFPNRRYFIVAPAAPVFYSSSKDGDCDVDGYQLFDFFLVGGVASSSSRSSSFSYESDKGVFFDNDNGLSYIRDEHNNQRHLSTALGLGGKAQCSSFVYLQDCYHFNARTGRWTEIVDFAGVPRGLCIGSRVGSGGCGIIIEPTTQCDGTKEESGRVRGGGTIFSTAAAAVETNEKKMKKSMGSTATDTQTAKSSSASCMVREIDDNNDDGIALVRGRVLLFHAPPPPPPPPPSLLPPVSVSDNDNDDATVPQPSHHSRSAAPASSSFVGSSGGGGGGSGDEVNSLRGTLTFINAKERVVLNLDKLPLPLHLPLLSKEEEGTQLHQRRQKKTRGEDGEVGLVVEEKREAVGVVRSQHVHRREQEQDALGNGAFSPSAAAHHIDFAAAAAAAPSSSLVPPSSVQFTGFGNAMLRKAAFEKINTAKKEEEKEEEDYDDFDYDKNDRGRRRRNFSKRSGKRQLFLFGGGGGRGRENKNHHHDPNNNPNPLFAALAAVSLETRRKQLSERIARLSKYLDEDDDDNIRRDDDDDDNNNNGVSGGKRERDDEVGWWAAAAKIEKERQERYLEKAYAIANAVSRFSHTCSITNTTTGTSTTSAALEEEGRGGDTLSKHDHHHHHLIGSNNHNDDDDDDENKTLLEAFFGGGSGGNKSKGRSEEDKQSLVIPSVSSLLNFLYITATTAPKPMAPLNPLTLIPITAATNDNDNNSTQQSTTSTTTTTYSAHHPRSPRSRGIGLWYEFEVLTLLLMTSSSSSSPNNNNNNNSSASSSSSGARRKRRTNTGIKKIGYTSTEACVGKVTFALGDAWATTNTDGTENKITTTNTATAKGAKDNAEGDVRDLEEKMVPSADPKTAAAAAMELAQDHQQQRPQYRATEENPHRFSSEMHHPLLTPPNNNEEEEEENFLLDVLDVGDLFGSTAATAAQTTTVTIATVTVVPEDSDEMGERENEDEIGGPSAYPSSSHALLGDESCNYAGAHDGAVGNREDDDDENVLIDVEDLFGEDDVGAVAVDKDEETYGHKNNNNNEEMNHDETTITISETCSGPPLPFLSTSTSSTPPLVFNINTSLAHLREEKKSTVATSSTTRPTATKQHDFAARNSVGNMVAGKSSVLAADTEDNEDIGAQFEFD